MKRNILLSILILVSVFCTITLYNYHNENTSVIEIARSDSRSSFIESKLGITRYKVFGNQNNQTVILIHSFNGFLESWDHNVPALVRAGYKVVTYDLFGRGLSDRPKVDYDLALFRNQLDLIVKKSGSGNLHLIGSSFGSVIAADFANKNPELVNSLIMLGPAGWPDKKNQNKLLNIPIVSDLAFHYFGTQILKPKVKAYFIDPSEHHNMVNTWSRFASYPGFTRSALSTLQNSPVLDYTSGYKALSKLDIPTLFIWGKQDVSFPFSNTKKLSKLMPKAQVIGIYNAAHWVNIEQANKVNKAIIEFLSVNKH
ncbi:alpha/beta hydrolase [Pseudoalteromonas sp. C2R02]|uniref:alpha/beta fold hydrolase n=1 Tax=Pseudoalteromonas sp. C2R02 TaxID=2841565 RepID=UPI001C0844DD|nr:alpha/beta hydrolase [Pseudoalteromonas sp. C2R02]MBU2972309.1 alpha/beta hydrolase [Pseudoalteromonas sp. C2R02]